MSTYTVIRYKFNGYPEVIETGLTLEEAQAHCSDPATSGNDWFDGYEEER